jgi:hypothetical protein
MWQMLKHCCDLLLRLIQSVPSPKAEPIKLWLAKVDYERIEEIEDPELATKRTRALYKAKGYSDIGEKILACLKKRHVKFDF